MESKLAEFIKRTPLVAYPPKTSNKPFWTVVAVILAAVGVCTVFIQLSKLVLSQPLLPSLEIWTFESVTLAALGGYICYAILLCHAIVNALGFNEADEEIGVTPKQWKALKKKLIKELPELSSLEGRLKKKI